VRFFVPAAPVLGEEERLTAAIPLALEHGGEVRSIPERRGAFVGSGIQVDPSGR
jgi:hypothetical protein